MKKTTTPAASLAEVNDWDIPEVAAKPKTKTTTPASTSTTAQAEQDKEPLYDLDGLMTDFPTAKELEKFVYDQTGFVLNLKGRSNKFKYQTAMDVLNGSTPDDYMLGTENPYLDKNELVPVDELKKLPPRPVEVRDVQPVATFITKQFDHPDADWKSQGQKCEVIFRKYVNNCITYEILGPIAPRAVGLRVNKFGKEVPEKYTWVDPRTGEQLIRKENGAYTPIGTRLRSAMQKRKINKSDYWSVWIDREFVLGDDAVNNTNDPWAT